MAYQVSFYNGAEIGVTEDMDGFLEMGAAADISGQADVPDGVWPDRAGDYEWCMYRPTETGSVAIVAVVLAGV